MFKLNFDIPPSLDKIPLQDRLLLMGSCFSENLGQKLIDHKFQAFINPFGTIYNPISMFRLLEDAIDDNKEVDWVENSAIFYDWNAHSATSALSENDLIQQTLQKRSELKNWIKSTKWIITPGTAWVYRLKTNNKLVANCHKIPQKEFKKELLDLKEVESSFTKVQNKIQEINPKTQWLFTVSPVRHIRDGLHENNISKSVLVLGIESITKSFSNCHDFPSYEMVIDELRDYRFCEKDMIHPNQLATDYIWSRFRQTYFDRKTDEFIEQWSKINQAIQHKPAHPTSAQHQKFLKETISKLEQLAGKVDVSAEMDKLKDQLI